MAGRCNPQRAARPHMARHGAFRNTQQMLFAMRFRAQTIVHDREVPSEGYCERVLAAGPR